MPELGTSDLRGMFSHIWDWTKFSVISLPLSNLIQVGTHFFLVDHSCPDVAIDFFVSLEKSFSFIFRSFLILFFLLLFCHQKKTLEHMSLLDCDLPVLTIKSFVL